MTRESIEDLRERLLGDEQVQAMISMRAYEIYKMRGERPGSAAEDWFQAEHEILAFLIDEESRRAAEPHDQNGSGASTPQSAASDATVSPIEPATEAPKEKRSRPRSAPKGASKRKAAAEIIETEDAVKKTPTKRTSSKKSTDGAAKPRRTRRQPAENQ